MFVREDLLNEIKGIFGIKELNYMKTVKTAYDATSLLFNSEGRTIGVEFEKGNTYYIYEVEEELGCCFIVEPMIQVSINEEETYLEYNKTTMSFPGKACDFTQEFIIAAMENC